jgi:hypothetical protein
VLEGPNASSIWPEDIDSDGFMDLLIAYYSADKLIWCRNQFGPGCTDADACNFNAFAQSDNGSCSFPGCLDPSAENYDANAGCAADSCTYLGDLDGDGEITLDDLLLLLGELGCIDDCDGDLDGDGVVTIFDLLIFLGVL